MVINKRKLHLLQIALKYYGTTEILGIENNPTIMWFAENLGIDTYTCDEIEWCALSINSCLKEAGLPYLKSVVARHGLKLGKETFNPEIGDLVFFWRESENSWKGHEGIYINRIDNDIYTLSGNQGDMFRIAPYPAYRLLGYRDLT